MRRVPQVLAFIALCASVLLAAGAALAQTRVRDLTVRSGAVPRRLVGYGLVVGLDGSGDRSFGSAISTTPSVRSVVNLLRRFDVQIPPERLRLRNVAAVVVTAEISPWLHAGGRFEVQVSALGDATSLEGGVLWMTPLVTDPGQPPAATAQGPLFVAGADPNRGRWLRHGNSGRIPEGGVLEADLPPVSSASRLVLRQPDAATAGRIASAVNAAFGANTAKVEDPGAITLAAHDSAGADLNGFLAAVETLSVIADTPARVVIDGREGTVVAGAGVKIGPAVVSHHGITLEVGGAPAPAGVTGLVRMDAQASVQDVAAGLHAAGARPDEIAAIFESLRAAGALRGEVVVR